MGWPVPENNLWFSINRAGRAVSYYHWVGRAAKVLARAISITIAPPDYAYTRTHTILSGRRVVLVFKITTFLRPSTYIPWSNGLDNQ